MPTNPAPCEVSFFVALPATEGTSPRFATLSGRVHAVTLTREKPKDCSLYWISVTSIALEEAAGLHTRDLVRGVLSHPQRLLVRAAARWPHQFTYWQTTPGDLTQLAELTEDEAAGQTMDGALRLAALRNVLTQLAEYDFSRWRRAARKRTSTEAAERVAFVADEMRWAVVEKPSEQ